MRLWRNDRHMRLQSHNDNASRKRIYCDWSCIHSSPRPWRRASRSQATERHHHPHTPQHPPPTCGRFRTSSHCSSIFEASVAGVNAACCAPATCVPIFPLEYVSCCSRASASADADHSSSSKHTWSIMARAPVKCVAFFFSCSSSPSQI